VFPQEPREDVGHRHLAQSVPIENQVPTDPLAVPAVPPSAPPTDPCAPPAESWVPLGLLRYAPPPANPDGNRADGEPPLTNVGRYYRQVFANHALSRLVFGLAERVDEAARVRVLTHVEGDGQAADVYHQLGSELVVKVIDSRNGVPPADLESIRVRFDPLTRSDDAVLLKTDGTPVTDPLPVETAAGPDQGTVKVKWKLGKQPGLHTVAARIVTADANHPQFHPGSQVLLHATARTTAPTVAGVRFDNLWCPDHCGNYHWVRNGTQVLSLTFSRKVNIDRLLDCLRVWAVFRRGLKGPISFPRPIPVGILQVDRRQDAYRPVGWPTDPGDRDKDCWQLDCRLEGLVEGLCPKDVLRVAVLLQAPDDAQRPTLRAAASGPDYPHPQVLDPTFAGSFLTRDYRDRLWSDRPFLDGEEQALANSRNMIGQPEPADPDLPADLAPWVNAFWGRFQPRDRSLPSGDGTEGGTVEAGTDFHKTFEFRLPCC
jgi:hypothetical protein